MHLGEFVILWYFTMFYDVPPTVVTQFPLTALVSFDETNSTPRCHTCISSKVFDRFPIDRQRTRSRSETEPETSGGETDNEGQDITMEDVQVQAVPFRAIIPVSLGSIYSAL